MKLIKTFELNHYSPIPLGDSLSARIYKNFWELLDPQAQLLSESDIHAFRHYQLQLDDLITNQSCAFIEEAGEKYKEAIHGYQRWLEGQEVDLLLLDKAESIEFVNHRIVASDPEVQQNVWRKHLKYQYLVMNHLKTKYRDSLTYYANIDAFQVVKDRELCRVEKLLNFEEGHEQHVLSIFMKAISLSYDPHSFYLSSTEKQYFDASLSVEAQGFGIHVTQNVFGETEIYQIVPGSPAWHSDLLEKGDIITFIKTDKNTIFDLYCSTIEETQSMLHASPYESVELAVRKGNGKIKTVHLRRAPVPMETNSLKSFILTGERKIGYIQIPSFYTSYNPAEPQKGVADDLAKELIQLRREKIDGVILDLRSNGGGSLHEAVKMAGIFIDQGPVLAVEFPNSEVEVVKDMNRGKLYSGPMVVMVNGHSASASELFAGCMQDYGRALITGSSTFGKSTVQRIFPAFTPMPAVTQEFVNVTIEMFYRVTGETHQNTGVLPDISLPEIFTAFLSKESKQAYALQPAKIDPVLKHPAEKLPVLELQQASSYRITEDLVFRKIKALEDSLAAQNTLFIRIPLKQSEFDSEFENISTRWNKISEVGFLEHGHFQLKIPDFRQELLTYEQVKKEEYEMIAKLVERDAYLYENFKIINDLINYRK